MALDLVHEWSEVRFAKGQQGWRECSCGFVATDSWEAQQHQDRDVAGVEDAQAEPHWLRGLRAGVRLDDVQS